MDIKLIRLDREKSSPGSVINYASAILSHKEDLDGIIIYILALEPPLVMEERKVFKKEEYLCKNIQEWYVALDETAAQQFYSIMKRLLNQ